MSWVKLDDRFFDNPKIASLSDDAQLAYLKALCYCARELTDGFVPVRKCQEFARPKVVKELMPALWEACESGVRVHDYLSYNPSREQAMAEREAARNRMFARRSVNVRPNIDGISPSPVKPVEPVIPEVPNGTSVSDAGEPRTERKRRPKRPQEVREITEADLDALQDQFPAVDVRAQHAAREDWLDAKGKRGDYVDHVAALRNWCRDKASGGGHGGTAQAFGHRAEPRPGIIEQVMAGVSYDDPNAGLLKRLAEGR